MENQMQQGRFTSNGTARTLAIRSDVDWIEIWNATTMAAPGAGTGVKFFWQRGMANDTAIEYVKTAVTGAIAPTIVATGGVSLTNTTVMSVSAPIALTAISNALPGVVTTGVPWGITLNNGDVVRLFSIVGGRQLESIDFQVGGVVPNTSFTLVNMPAIVAVAAPGANAVWRKVSFDSYFYPRYRYICQITNAANAVVTTTVDHGYTIGQVVRMNVPEVFGMREMNGLQGTIIATPTPATFTLNIDSTAFAAFAFPLTAIAPFTPATVVPFGDAAMTPYESILTGATLNTGLIGVTLAAGVNSPAGVNTNVIYWRAGTSYIVDNQ
jgi:hypothetical protein